MRCEHRDSRSALRSRLWETFRKATSTSDARSVCSVESSKRDGYFRKKFREASEKKHQAQPKEEPPRKPVRHSLQRATSTSNVYCTDPLPDLNPSLKRTNLSDTTLFPQWMIQQQQQQLETQSNVSGGPTKKKHHGIRWPSLRPANSMSYSMANSGHRTKS